jgi:hypothetical protein
METFYRKEQKGKKSTRLKSLFQRLPFLLYTYTECCLVLCFLEFVSQGILLPILEAARSKAWVCGRSLTGIVGSNPTGSMDVCLL